VYWLKHDRFFGHGRIYLDRSAFAKQFAEAKRFLFFSTAVRSLFTAPQAPSPFRPDILHAHDWHTGALVAGAARDVPTVFTIHNLGNQGVFGAQHVASFLGVERNDLGQRFTVTDVSSVNLILQGIATARVVTTVSPTYAREITGQRLGFGLEKALRARAAAGDLMGILNGLDVEAYNPATDRSLWVRYDRAHLARRSGNRRALHTWLGWLDDGRLLIALVARLTEQKGIDLVVDAIPSFAALGVRLVVLGQGERKFEQALATAARRYPKTCRVFLEFNDGLARQLYSGSDAFLMPSRFEPAGLTQLLAMRYGCVPIVHRTGGLTDTVTDAADAAHGTGFTFKVETATTLLAAVARARRAFNDKLAWQRLQKNGLRQDFSWIRSAKMYEHVYKKILEPISKTEKVLQ
jgi:starch synthase